MADHDDSEQISRVVDFARVHLERYSAYHLQKESMAYTGLALFAGASGAILISDKWPPPPWGDYRTPIAFLAVFLLWIIIFKYLRYQLQRRRWAALRVAGCEHVLAMWSTGELTKDSQLKAKHREPVKELSWFCYFFDWLWPQKNAVRAVANPRKGTGEPPLYPGVLLDEWVQQEERGTDALKHERLIMVGGWGLFIALLLRTYVGAISLKPSARSFFYSLWNQ